MNSTGPTHEEFEDGHDGSPLHRGSAHDTHDSAPVHQTPAWIEAGKEPDPVDDHRQRNRFPHADAAASDGDLLDLQLKAHALLTTIAKILDERHPRGGTAGRSSSSALRVPKQTMSRTLPQRWYFLCYSAADEVVGALHVTAPDADTACDDALRLISADEHLSEPVALPIGMY